MKHPVIFLCPSCQQPLKQNGQSYTCKHGHNFDISKEGYVNLLLSSSQHAKSHGDNRDMIRARRDFLNLGYYSCLREKLKQEVLSICQPFSNPVLIDAGCGEGYYTTAVYQAIAQEKQRDKCAVYGFDMSKEALRIASKRCRQIHFAVANLFSMPLPDHCADFIMELFAPIAEQEFYRVLKPGGILLLVIPAKEHLFQLKQAIYDTPYYNETKPFSLQGFSFLRKENVNNTIELSGKTVIRNLFSMTPYFYHTPAKFLKRLEELERLTTKIDFDLFFFQKK